MKILLLIVSLFFMFFLSACMSSKEYQKNIDNEYEKCKEGDLDQCYYWKSSLYEFKKAYPKDYEKYQNYHAYKYNTKLEMEATRKDVESNYTECQRGSTICCMNIVRNNKFMKPGTSYCEVWKESISQFKTNFPQEYQKLSGQPAFIYNTKLEEEAKEKQRQIKEKRKQYEKEMRKQELERNGYYSLSIKHLFVKTISIYKLKELIKQKYYNYCRENIDSKFNETIIKYGSDNNINRFITPYIISLINPSPCYNGSGTTTYKEDQAMNKMFKCLAGTVHIYCK